MSLLSQKVNVVIPVLNGAVALAELLPQLAGLEVIVVDGGSSDGSAEVATSSGAPADTTLLTCEANRGKQLAKGAGHTTKEWILFLHADSTLPGDWQTVLAAFIETDSHPIAVFRFRLDDKRWRARVVETFVRMRGRIFGLPYGDQGLLIHRTAYLKAGGFPPLPALEDLVFIQRFGKKEICFLEQPLTTSAAKFQQHGYLRQTSRNIFLLLLVLCGAGPTRLAKRYGGKDAR